MNDKLYIWCLTNSIIILLMLIAFGCMNQTIDNIIEEGEIDRYRIEKLEYKLATIEQYTIGEYKSDTIPIDYKNFK